MTDSHSSSGERAALRAFLASPLLRVIIQVAGQTGSEAVLIGGAVRDLLLGRMPIDLDFAVADDAIPLARRCADQMQGVFYVMDAERGVARAIIPRDRFETHAAGKSVCDFATRRGRSWAEDLSDRDFTINAIACRLDADATLIDPLGGADDLRRRALRMAAPTAIRSDPVRAIRGVRLAHQFDCAVDPDTWRAMHEAAAHLAASSAERVRDAFLDALALPDPGPHAAAVDLARLGLLDVIVPAWRGEAARAPQLDLLAAAQRSVPLLRARLSAAAAHDLTAHLDDILTEGRPRRTLLLLSALLPPGPTCDAQLKALRLSAVERGVVRRIHTIQTSLDTVLAAGEIQGDSQKRAAHQLLTLACDAAPEAVCHGLARRALTQSPGAADYIAAGSLIELYFDRYAPGRQPEPLLTGQDLIDTGMRPGVMLGNVLDAVREAQLTGAITTREQALALALHGGGKQ